MGTFAPWASWISDTICDRKLSSPTFVARMPTAPVRLSEPPVTGEPALLTTGSDSPVIIDSSTVVVPDVSSPSLGIRSPGLTRSIVPSLTASMGIIISLPSSSTILASRAWMDTRARISFDALSLRWDSMYLPVMCSAIIIAPTAPKETT